MIEHPIGPSVDTAQVLTTTDANSVPSTTLSEPTYYAIWCASDFYHFLAANNTPVAGAATMPRFPGGHFYVLRTEPDKTFVHIARTAAADITAYVFPLGAGS